MIITLLTHHLLVTALYIRSCVATVCSLDNLFGTAHSYISTGGKLADPIKLQHIKYIQITINILICSEYRIVGMFGRASVWRIAN